MSVAETGHDPVAAVLQPITNDESVGAMPSTKDDTRDASKISVKGDGHVDSLLSQLSDLEPSAEVVSTLAINHETLASAQEVDFISCT